MPIENFLAFILASIVILIIPGPSIIMAVGQAIAHGRKAVIPTVAGVAVGDMIATTLSMVGVGSILLASSTAFMIIKWAGVAYLIYLGIKMLISNGHISVEDGDIPLSMASPAVMFRNALVVTALNPKGIVFFIAFVPQFISAEHAFAPQAAICILTFLILAIINMWLYTALAARAREGFKNPSIIKWAERTGGGLLISAGLISAAKT